ncbi:hypothetical protein [Marinobacterium jannaschii]|uniref:hypothetical protein n=1 Tax=Marinobacterium jannaschii TaxID=64970 RepID=UPI000481F797|nr:hypothetical protein [Marinobacterium jannaschii]
MAVSHIKWEVSASITEGLAFINVSRDGEHVGKMMLMLKYDRYFMEASTDYATLDLPMSQWMPVIFDVITTNNLYKPDDVVEWVRGLNHKPFTVVTDADVLMF